MEKSKRSAWEEWARVDPLWAIVTSDGKEFGGWELDEFFKTGHETVDSLGQRLPRSEFLAPRIPGLDFGCGVGRLTRALGERVDEVTGLDVTPSMITLAHDYNAAHENLTFLVHKGTDLHQFEDGRFDVVCCLLVLQHLASDKDILTYIGEFDHVLAPGGLLLLQLPDVVPAASRHTGFRAIARPRTRLGHLLSRLGVPASALYRRLNWKPEMTMRAISKDSVVQVVAARGGRLVLSPEPLSDPLGVRNVFYFITRD